MPNTPTRDGRGRVALVTGAASGIGLATAGVLARHNWRVVVSDLDEARCRAAAAPIGAETCVLDVTDDAATEAALDTIEARLGPVGHPSVP